MEWFYLLLGILILILFLFSFTSCAVVKTDFSSAAKKEATVYYYLPESSLKIKSIARVEVVYKTSTNTLASARVIQQSFTLTDNEIIADTKDLLALNYRPNALMNDEVEYKVNPKGLLESVNIVTEDRTPDIVAQLAQAPQIILGIPSGGQRGVNIVSKIMEFSEEFTITASEISKKDTVEWNLLIPNELNESAPKIVSAKFRVETPDLNEAPKLKELINGDNNSTSTEVKGILTRPLKNVKISIYALSMDLEKTFYTHVIITDPSKLIIIPVTRTAFVKRVNAIQIQDGIILSHKINKPSSVEGFITIPINILKAVVSIPAQLIQFRYDNTQRSDELEKARLNYEKTLKESEKFLLEKEQEIKKLKEENQKSELSEQVEVQKNMDVLKKQIEELKTELEELKKEK